MTASGAATHAPRLREIGDKEGPAMRLGQRRRDRTYAAPIGVGLDHRRAFRLGALAQRLEIRGDIRQIDLEDAARLRFRRPVEGHAGCKPFVVDQEAAAFVDDFSVDRALNDDMRALLDGQAAKQIAANVKGAVPLHDRVIENRAMNIGRAADQQRPVLGSLF